ncbi:TM2 domain-containing membrane protein [Deinococcus geothermalis DSM 11300]|uniref:TM2 domain-containing membrane protein n=1 Tax=Deinococcus geothermalis (strain DSM 11300 / CIP 105573 / AG-3a) TaxID=319795 RepID=Q1J1V5_DEIGD|nr:NINE protein [Deinococcus geothermalis]ABF44529.1 TM2 domain-containing membrane protein [Deinococcus geothermalis DSM 11300]
MTNSDEKSPETAPGREVPAWVDEVLRAETAPLPAREPVNDLRIPEPAPTQPGPHAAGDDWVARVTGNTARTPQVDGEPPSSPSTWPENQPRLATDVPADIAQKRLIAGLLGIVLGSLGVHKFYLGLNTPGVIMLGVSIGVWVLAFLLGLLTLGFGLILTLPLAALVSGAVGLLGLIEGILYLTKSDEAFYREYVIGQKPWL